MFYLARKFINVVRFWVLVWISVLSRFLQPRQDFIATEATQWCVSVLLLFKFSFLLVWSYSCFSDISLVFILFFDGLQKTSSVHYLRRKNFLSLWGFVTKIFLRFWISISIIFIFIFFKCYFGFFNLISSSWILLYIFFNFQLILSRFIFGNKGIWALAGALAPCVHLHTIFFDFLVFINFYGFYIY